MNKIRSQAFSWSEKLRAWDAQPNNIVDEFAVRTVSFESVETFLIVVVENTAGQSSVITDSSSFIIGMFIFFLINLLTNHIDKLHRSMGQYLVR